MASSGKQGQESASMSKPEQARASKSKQGQANSKPAQTKASQTPKGKQITADGSITKQGPTDNSDAQQCYSILGRHLGAFGDHFEGSGGYFGTIFEV